MTRHDERDCQRAKIATVSHHAAARTWATCRGRKAAPTRPMTRRYPIAKAIRQPPADRYRSSASGRHRSWGSGRLRRRSTRGPVSRRGRGLSAGIRLTNLSVERGPRRRRPGRHSLRRCPTTSARGNSATASPPAAAVSQRDVSRPVLLFQVRADGDRRPRDRGACSPQPDGAGPPHVTEAAAAITAVSPRSVRTSSRSAVFRSVTGASVGRGPT